MDRLHEEIKENMRQVDNVMILPMETWNKLSRYVHELEQDKGTADALRGYIKHLEEGQADKDKDARLKELETMVADQATFIRKLQDELQTSTAPGIHIENLYVTVNHFNDNQIYDEADQIGNLIEEEQHD